MYHTIFNFLGALKLEPCHMIPDLFNFVAQFVETRVSSLSRYYSNHRSTHSGFAF